jgi:integrase/recombinase XerC
MTDRATVQGAVLGYLRHLEVRNCREQTIYNRRRALARLTAWANGRPLLTLTGDELAAWQDERTGQILASSRRAELSSVREFYRWALREGRIKKDPTARLFMPRAPRGMPRPVGERDLADALAVADPWMAAILGLAAFAGLRACEIARLDWSEVGFNDDPPSIRIVDGKGGRGRVVPLAPTLAELLLALPTRRGPVIRRVNGYAGHNTPNLISGITNRYLHSVGVRETLHQLRHRFATKTYRACQDIRAVQELLGHQSPTTTSIYAAASPGVALDAVLAASVISISA